jgi:hypothetical protein
MPNKSSSSNDVSFYWTLFPISSSSSSSFFIIYWPIEMTFIFIVCVCIHSSYVYLANLRVVICTIYIMIEPSTFFLCFTLIHQHHHHHFCLCGLSSKYH